ncbi:hypothetical protein Poli38472_009226 [Pythium oligandrum]|uniref:Dihydrolipoamide acetyltransferase component of pyruvate dehydrogenase complex n=1 Tax=Pythium oligandrum TaxID=41045 RepID=A0A8K1CL42_PYTOL|nr:hypothetical protein Poli38472_009226 [Pythium oligandrum]|eukprot:TMW65059.1 hypothetical protein Poli38472_009226 [Pythium oligandrum]
MSSSYLDTTTTRSASTASSVSGVTPHYHPAKKSGHLYKKSGIARKWKTLFFSLEGTVLYYYKREGDTVPKGTILLTGCRIKPTKSKKYYSFRISHPKTSKVYDLASTMESRTEDWVETLRDASNAIFSQGPGSRMELDLRPSAMEEHRPSMADMPHRPSSLSVVEMPTPYSPDFVVSDEDLEAIAADHAEIPLAYREQLESLMAEFLSQTRDNADGWKLQSEQRDCKVFTSTRSRSGGCKSVGFINHHPYHIIKLLLELSRRHTFDPQLMATRRAYVFDDHTFIDHLVYKPVFPAAARDFLHITHWRVLKNGSIVLIATSVEREDLCPRKEPDIVRAHTSMGGFLITPNADYTGARADYIVKSDVKGGIPAALQAKLFIKQAYVIDGLRRALEDANEAATDLPRVSNRTLFGVTTSDLEMDHDEVNSSRSNDEHDEDDDESVHSSSNGNEIPAVGIPSVPEKYRELIEKAIARMDVDMDEESAWTFHSEKHGVKAYTKIDGSLTAAKGVGHVPYNPRAFWEVVMDVANKKSYDSGLAQGVRLGRVDAQTVLDYVEYKPVFVVAGRDFCNLVHWRVLPNGTIIIVVQSVEDLEVCPLKEPKVIRGEVHIAGWRIVPDPDYKGAHVTYMVKSDLKGSVPSRIAGKAASEQPYLIYQISQVLKKSKTLDQVAALGKLTNTIGVPSTEPAPLSKPRSSTSPLVKAVAKTPVVSAPVKAREPAPEPKFEPAAKKTTPATEDVLDKPSADLSQKFLIENAVQFVGAILALKLVSLPGVLHYGVVIYLLVYFVTQFHMGPSNMSPRRKLMIASFGPPDSGMILGTLQMDMTKTQKYIQEKRQTTGNHITITHIVLRSIAAALAKAPSVNGHIVFGNYYPAPTVDISCLVAVEGGKDLGVCRLSAADKMSLKDVCDRVRGDAGKLRSGNDQAQRDRNVLMNMLPTFVIRPVVNLVGWLGGCLGLRIKPVGVEPYMFGSCMVTSVGMMGMELAFAPLTPYAQTPMLVTIGAVKDTPVVVNGKIEIRPILTLTTTIDHRYVDGSQAARMGVTLKQCIEDPSLIEPVNA